MHGHELQALPPNQTQTPISPWLALFVNIAATMDSIFAAMDRSCALHVSRGKEQGLLTPFAGKLFASFRHIQKRVLR